MMRDAIVMALRRVRPHSNIVELDSLEAINDAAISHGTPALVSMDISLPDNESASGAGIVKVRSLFPRALIAVFSTHPASEMEEVSVASGADIYIEKASGRNEYAAGLQTLLEAHPDPGDSGPPSTKLSKRQKQMVKLIETGLTTAEMAVVTGLTESGIKLHLHHLYRKLGVSNRSRALHIARVNGLID